MDNKNFLVRLIGLDVLNFNLPKPVVTSAPLEIGFELTVENQVVESNRLVINKPTLFLVNKQNSEMVFGSITIGVTFEIENFYETVIKASNEKYEVDLELDRKLTLISLNTLRGVAFSLFRQTYLPNIILPLIELDNLERTLA